MECRILVTDGSGKFIETTWDKPEPTSDQVEVKALMTGICRSDIDMMNGNFGPLPLEMQGHEGLGVITKVGSDVEGFREGDLVATRGEPAYSDFYNSLPDDIVLVPEISSKFIIEPIACGVNVITQPMGFGRRKLREVSSVLIIGSGFLAWVAFNYLTKRAQVRKDCITVIGSSNKDLWDSAGVNLEKTICKKYDFIVDLASHKNFLDSEIYNNNAVISMAAQKDNGSNLRFGPLLWSSSTMHFPSPRNPYFKGAMGIAVQMVSQGQLDIGGFWTKGYNRDTEWEQAFSDGNSRPDGYSRGYLTWS